MQKLTQIQLSQMIELHQLWLKNDKDGVRLDLSKKNCSRLFFNPIGIVGVDLSHSICQYTNFYEADLENVNLYASNLSYSRFDKVFIKNVNFTNVDFTFAYIDRTDFSNIDMSSVNFYEASIQDGALLKLPKIPIKMLRYDEDIIRELLKEDY